MLTFLTPSFSDPVCLTVVQIFAKASQVVLFWIGKARGRSGELGLRVCLGELSWRQDRCNDLGAALPSSHPASRGRLTDGKTGGNIDSRVE